MGYHIINICENIPCINYFETLEELEESGCLNSESYFFEGKTKHIPQLISKESELFYITEEKFIAGKKAEQLFSGHALENGVNLLSIPQKDKFFKTRQSKTKVKRSDYITTSLYSNYQIEVKCLTIYPLPKKFQETEGCYYFSIEQLERHKNMQLEEYKDPTIVAIYERFGKEPKKGSLRMISIADIFALESHLRFEKEKIYKIPLSRMSIGFDLLCKGTTTTIS